MLWMNRPGLRAAAIAGAVVVVGQFAFAAGASATEPAARAAHAAGRGWVTGVVVDADGQPIKGALVNAVRATEVPELGILADQTDRRDWTNASGEFRVRQAKGGFLLQVCTPEPGYREACKEPARGTGYLITYAGPSGVTNSWLLQTELFAVSGDDQEVGEVEVQPQGYLRGTIDGGGGQLVVLERLNGTIAYRFPTKADGSYRMKGIAPGQYRVAAGGNGWLPFESEVVTVEADQTTRVDGAITKGAGVRGTLLHDGNPVSYTDVLFKSAGGRLIAAATTDENGHYEVSGQLPGDYVLGILYDGGPYLRKAVHVTLTNPERVVRQDIEVRKGAVATVVPKDGDTPVEKMRIELRDADGTPVSPGYYGPRGTVKFLGLKPGNTYTYVIADAEHFVKRTFEVTGPKVDLGTKRLTRDTLTLSGTTAPKAVVEAMTGNQCPADGPHRGGSFHEIVVADAAGNYEITGLVPGTYMLGSAGWPQNYAPVCEPGFVIDADTVHDLPLEVGGTVSGRFVYASTGTPVIARLTYGLTYPKGSAGQPTEEQPARATSRGATGEFVIDALGADTVTGQLMQFAGDDNINDEEFFVRLPYQDGTPYYLTSEQTELEVGPGIDVDLGDVELTLHGE